MNDYRDRVQKYIKKQEFLNLVGFIITKIYKGYIEGSLKLENKHKQQKGLLHGGVTATIADVVSGFAAYTLLGPNEHVVTAEIKISYLNPGLSKEIWAKGWVLKSGKRLHFCEAEVYSLNGTQRTMIAKATSTMAVIQESDLAR